MTEQRLAAADARADIEQLIGLLTSSHPDPYGPAGPIAFHRLAWEVLQSVPDDGLAPDELLRLIRPLVASLGDGHTVLMPASGPGEPAPAPLLWDAVEEELYVAAVRVEQYRHLLGARLTGVNGVPFADLQERMEGIRGADNLYNNLVHLADALEERPALLDLLDVEPGREVRVELALPAGGATYVTWPEAMECSAMVRPPSAIELPAPGASQLEWSFLPGGSVALLRIGPLNRYREHFEICRSVGNVPSLGEQLAEAASAALEGPPPPDVDGQIAAVPSATDLFSRLVAALAAERTETLLVDLRDCPGGNSFASIILTYCLWGVESLLSADSGYQIERYSPLYLRNYRVQGERRLEEIEACLANGGYDFSGEAAWLLQGEGMSDEQREDMLRAIEDQIALSPTFAAAFDRERKEPRWTGRVVVFTSARTYSAGFDLAADLVRRGAVLAGVPSAQSGNCFIDCLRFGLDRSGIEGLVSFKRSMLFPEDAKRGRLLVPDIELTYEQLRAMQFDPNASLRLVLEDLGEII